MYLKYCTTAPRCLDFVNNYTNNHPHLCPESFFDAFFTHPNTKLTVKPTKNSFYLDVQQKFQIAVLISFTFIM